jgi:hypothetical protein
VASVLHQLLCVLLVCGTASARSQQQRVVALLDFQGTQIPVVTLVTIDDLNHTLETATEIGSFSTTASSLIRGASQTFPGLSFVAERADLFVTTGERAAMQLRISTGIGTWDIRIGWIAKRSNNNALLLVPHLDSINSDTNRADFVTEALQQFVGTAVKNMTTEIDSTWFLPDDFIRTAHRTDVAFRLAEGKPILWQRFATVDVPSGESRSGTH